MKILMKSKLKCKLYGKRCEVCNKKIRHGEFAHFVKMPGVDVYENSYLIDVAEDFCRYMDATALCSKCMDNLMRKTIEEQRSISYELRQKRKEHGAE